MSNTLLLFLFSERVDPYINAIAHTYDRMQVQAVRFIYVRGTNTGLTDSQASTVFAHVLTQIKSLASGKYTDFYAKDKDGHLITPSPEHPLQKQDNIDIYRRINERLLDRHLIPLDYDDLKKEFGQVVKKQGGPSKCIIDVTAAAKAPSIDIFSVCLALGVSSVYTFELADRPDPQNPQNSLYHSLDKDKFSYTCINDTAPVKASQSALLRRSSLLWSVSAVALAVLLVSLYLLVSVGTDSLTVQTVNLVAAVIGIASPLFALFQQRKYG